MSINFAQEETAAEALCGRSPAPGGGSLACDRSSRQLGPMLAWANSTLAPLTGRPDREPTLPHRAYGPRLEALLAAVRRVAPEGVVVDAALYGERAAELGLGPCGAASCNGSAHLLRAADGWVALNLARGEDEALIPALVGEPAPPGWPAIADLVRKRRTQDLQDQARLLGLPLSRVPRRIAQTRAPVQSLRFGERRAGLAPRDCLVVDLSSLWAGPLCGALLAEAGCRVIKVESVGRPDAARSGSPRLFDRLHFGQEMVALNFRSPEGRAALRALLRRADVVIEATRPRALDQLGVGRRRAFAERAGLVWVGLTARGLDDPSAVGFGDDVAAGAGLLAWDEAGPMFVGDALADPIAGLFAATGAFMGMREGGGVFLDVSMHDAATYVAAAQAVPDWTTWCVESDGAGWRIRGPSGSMVVAAPWERPSRGRARAFGHDTDAVVRELT